MTETISYEHLIQLYKKQYPKNSTQDTAIKRAYEFAHKAHQNQKRASGEPYFTHVYKTATKLASWKLDAPTIIAGLLHDTMEDCAISPETIRKEFGEEVLFLIEGVTKLGTLRYKGVERNAESLRKMMLATTRDLRVLFIKLADRLHNMQTLKYVASAKQKRIALETTEIYAPLASRLGIQSVAGELEDLAFPYIHPDEYKWVQKNITESFEKRTRYIQFVQNIITNELHNAGIQPITVDSRAKRIASLYKKLTRHDMNIDQIYDLVAVRIIVSSVEECYLVLGIIHQLWKPLPGHIKDFIALPKINGYQSLHTTVFCVDNKPTEFQIRTQHMHEQAELGAAAHWFYEHQRQTKQFKKGVVSRANTEDTSIVKQLREWQNQFPGSKEFVDALKLDIFSDRIFVLTPTGEVIDLPAEATPIDFAYRIHTTVGDSCTGARVNDKLVPLNHPLQSGDIVEILTQKNKKPSESWLAFVKTRYATKKIKASVNKKILIPKKIEYKIICTNRTGIVRDILSVLSRNHISLIGIQTTENGRFLTAKVTADISQREKGERIFLKLRAVKGVDEINFKMI